MLKDIEISQNAKMLPIEEVAKRVDLEKEDLDFYGKYKAKINQSCYEKLKEKEDGKLVLVTAVNPTPAGEGKTTVSIGLAQGLFKLGKKAVLALREPSLGPVFGIKGGATGGGYSQVVPMEDINLHFTGDMHAITAANNLLAALIDSHIHNGNELKINPKTIVFKRCLDVNDRALRNVVVGLGEAVDGVTRQDGFIITVASEIMAILCLSEDLQDLKTRCGNILVGYSYDKTPIFVKDLNVQGAMAALMKDALNPNLVQTLENTPALIHGGPFANIAHGCNSVKATKLALKLADYAVLVVTVRALKYNGGILKENLKDEDVLAVKKGLCNLKKHIENVRLHCSNLVVAINKFTQDTEEEIMAIKNCCEEEGVLAVCANVFEKGGEGAKELANEVIKICEKPTDFRYLYDLNLSLEEKVKKIATCVYGALDVTYEDKAKKQLMEFEKMGFNNLPVCIAKTQYSLSTDPKKLGRPKDFSVLIKEVRLSAGAGFVVIITNNVMTMPGLGKNPAAKFVDVVDDRIVGIF